MAEIPDWTTRIYFFAWDGTAVTRAQETEEGVEMVPFNTQPSVRPVWLIRSEVISPLEVNDDWEAWEQEMDE